MELADNANARTALTIHRDHGLHRHLVGFAFGVFRRDIQLLEGSDYRRFSTWRLSAKPVRRLRRGRRLPTISCARAVDAASVTANMTKGHEFLNMGNPSIAMTEKTSRAERGNDVRHYWGDLAQDQARRQLQCRGLSMGGGTADSGAGVT